MRAWAKAVRFFDDWRALRRLIYEYPEHETVRLRIRAHPTMTTAQAAAYLMITRKRLVAWRDRGAGPRFDHARGTYASEDIFTWLRQGADITPGAYGADSVSPAMQSRIETLCEQDSEIYDRAWQRFAI